MKTLLTIFFYLLFLHLPAQDTFFLKVHFLYGSKPAKKYQDTEPKWFGGMLGGHVGLEGDTGKILSLLPSGSSHWFSEKHNRHSTYTAHSFYEFYSILGGNADSVKKAVVYIPLTIQQK